VLRLIEYLFVDVVQTHKSEHYTEVCRVDRCRLCSSSTV